MQSQNDLTEHMNQAIKDLDNRNSKETKFVSDSEISKIQLSNFPRYMKICIFIFKFCHYFLLLFSCFQMVNRRYKQYNELLDIEKKKLTEEEKLEYFSFTGVIYAKYNLEILNFIFYLLIVSNFNRLSLCHFLSKLLIGEGLLISLAFFKIIKYYFEKINNNPKFPINLSNLLSEISLLLAHLIVVGTFIVIYLGFKNSRENKNIYRVHYLGKKIKRAG